MTRTSLSTYVQSHKLIFVCAALVLCGCQIGHNCSENDFTGLYRVDRISVPDGVPMVSVDSFVERASDEWWVECDPELRFKDSQLRLSADHTFHLRNTMLVDSVGKWHIEDWEDMCVVKLNFSHVSCIGHLAMGSEGAATLHVCDMMFRDKCYVGTFEYKRASTIPER
ncbi:MAG: hypothetical protein KA408_08265 [Flavobacteriales bacterium]|nr:hypothetical protein [Flavobacteriales bacterium]